MTLSTGFLLFSIGLYACAYGQSTANPVDEPALPHRVSLVTPLPANKGDLPSCPFRTDAWKTWLLAEGVQIEAEEWAKATDLAKQSIAASEMFRLFEPASAASDSAYAGLALYLVARFGVGTSGARAFLRLTDASGAVLADHEGQGASMKEAIEKALAALAAEAATMPWRCRVSGINDAFMIIDRGHLDGLREGQTFSGYAIGEIPSGTPVQSAELLLMQFGKKVGRYQVVEAGRDFAKVKPLDGAPVLKAGDILEQTEIRLNDRTRGSRGRRVWDKLYP
jgi:hypothetical protein